MRDDFLKALAESMGLDAAFLTEPGTSVIGTPSRAESKVSAGYMLGEHFVVSCDPDVESMLATAVVGMTPTLEAWNETAGAVGGELLGGARMQLLGADLPDIDQLPHGFHLRSLHRDRVEDFALITRLIDSSHVDDLDAAEIEIDDLDEIIEVIVDDAGEIASYSAARPFDRAPAFGDIGILTRPEHRGLGLGATLVAALSARLRAEGLEPLYRCDDDNIGSVNLSAGLGFEIATELTGYRFAHSNL